MHRFFAQRIDADTAVLPQAEENHALRVLRLKQGDPCQALIDGHIYAAEMKDSGPPVTLRLLMELPSTEPSVRVTLFQGIPKGDKMDWIVQKGTEAGVSRIVPVDFSRCVARWEGKDAQKKQARFQRIMAEAAKQSGRALTPEMALPVSIAQLCDALPAYDLALAPWEEERGKGIRSAWQGQKNVAIVIGPEGGIAQEEIDQMRAMGARTVTLGPRIFRTETAGLAAILSLLTLSGDLE